MATLPLPRIDSVACTGCGLCIELCATNALEQRLGKAVLTRPESCTYCRLCEDRCPENAIALPFLITLAKPRRADSSGNVSAAESS